MAQAQAAKWGTSQVREWHRLAAHIQPGAKQLNSYTTNKFTKTDRQQTNNSKKKSWFPVHFALVAKQLCV